MPPQEKLNTEPACAAGVAHAQQIKDLKIDGAKQWEVIDKIRDRLPVWATLLMTSMGVLVGSALTYAAMSAKFATMAAKVAAAAG